MIYVTGFAMYREGVAYKVDGSVALNVDHLQYIFQVKQDDGRMATMVSIEDGMEMEVAETPKQLTDAILKTRRDRCVCGSKPKGA